MLSVLSIGAWAQTSPYTGVAVNDITSGESFYLYNVDFGKWLGDNDRNKVYGWTSHAEIGSRGRDIQITAVEGGYQLNPKLGHNHSINADNLYMDTGSDVTTWTITPLNNGISNAVKIKSGSYGLSVNDSGDMDQNADSGEKHNNWQIVTAEERWNVAKAAASLSNPVNVSWCVLGGTFPIDDEHRSNGTWNGTTNGNSGYGDQAVGGDGTYHCNRVWEMWNITSKDVYQTITVPNGIYKVSAKAAYVSTGGSGMSSAHYDEWVADPTGNTKGVVYANSKSTPMINAYAMTTDAKVDNKVTKDLGNGKWVSDGTGQFSTRMFDGEFKTNDIWVNVTDNTLKVGVKVENGTGSSWILFDDFTVTYYGDFGNQLTQTVAYAKAKGVDVSAQENLLENGSWDVNNSDPLNATIIALKQHMAEKSTQPTIFSMPSTSVVGTDDNVRGTVVTNHADGYYVYNVGTGRWFCGGDDWGAHAAVGFPGIKVTTPANDYRKDENNCGYYNSVKTWLFNGNWNDGGLLNNNGYCDTGGNAWKFWRKDAAQGIYTWSNNGSNTGTNEGNGCGTKDLVGFAPSTYSRVNVHQSDDNDPNNQWIFVTEAQRDAMAEAAMASASTSNPVDLTYKIKMPGFNQRERKEGTNQSSEELDWTCNHANYKYSDGRLLLMGRGENHSDFVCDVYGDTWDNSGSDFSFSWTQRVTGLTPGRYRVKVQGYNNGGDVANKAYLLANGQKATLVEHSSESVLPWTSRLPGATFEAPEYFQVGCYWNEVLCTVGSNGELTLGVESPSITGSHVVIFDNFRLEYVGAYVELNEGADNSGISKTANAVTLNRTLKKDKWNTFCVPFAMTADQIADQLGDDAEVKALASAVKNGDNYTMTFSDAASIEAGKPYMVKVSDNISTIEITDDDSGIAVNTSVTYTASKDGVNFYGTYSKGFAPLNSFIISDNVFYQVDQENTVNLKGFRGYITVNGAEVKALNFDFEGDATGISLMEDGRSKMEDGAIYNVAGQRLNKMQKGINRVNGKKILK